MHESLDSGSVERRSRRTWRSEKRVLVPLGSAWLLGAAVLGLAASADNPELLFFDPSFTGQHPNWYVGIVSQLGILCWSIAALSAAWSAWFAGHVGRPSAERFLRHGAFVTVVLLLDDLFGFHAVVSSLLAVPKPIMQVCVVAPCGWWLVTYSADIVRTRWPVLAAALGALAMSLVVERLTGGSMASRATIAEDGPKFLGIVAWATYFALTSIDIARSVLQETHTRRAPAPDRPDEVELALSGDSMREQINA